MKTIFKRFTIIVLAVIMVSSVLFSCSKEEFDSDVSAREVMTIGSYTVYYDEFRYLYLNYKEQMDGGDLTYWSSHPGREEDILTYVNDALMSTYGTLELAKSYNVELTADEKATVLDTEKSTIESIGSEDAFQLALDGSFMSRRVFRKMLEFEYIEEKLYNILTSEMNNYIPSDDATIDADIRENFIRVQQIILVNEAEGDEEANRAQAEELLMQLRAGADFEELMSQYSDDLDAAYSTDGYYFTRGEFKLLPGFDDIAFNLSEGEISEIYESPTSFHIIRRVPLEDDYIKTNFETLRAESIARRYYEFVDSAAEGMKVTHSELYPSLGLTSVT